MNETSKSLIRRLYDSRFSTKFFVGEGIDIGAGPDPLAKYFQQFPLMKNLRIWDRNDGNAQLMSGVEDNTFDFVHSSHCLEHLEDPYEAFENWIRICKPGGHIVITIPDEDLYEQGSWPSQFNPEHLTSWTILKNESWSEGSINLIEFLYQYKESIEVIKVELIDHTYIYDVKRFDQTYHGISESAIEFVVRKRTDKDKELKGRYIRP